MNRFTGFLDLMEEVRRFLGLVKDAYQVGQRAHRSTRSRSSSNRGTMALK
jgi:hypothetical protein